MGFWILNVTNKQSVNPPWQVTGKLNYTHTGMYFIYLGAVVGSSGLIYFFATAYFINLEALPDDESFKPNRSRTELFVKYSP